MVETTKIIIIKFILSKMMFIVYYQRQRVTFQSLFITIFEYPQVLLLFAMD